MIRIRSTFLQHIIKCSVLIDLMFWRLTKQNKKCLRCTCLSLDFDYVQLTYNKKKRIEYRINKNGIFERNNEVKNVTPKCLDKWFKYMCQCVPHITFYSIKVRFFLYFSSKPTQSSKSGFELQLNWKSIFKRYTLFQCHPRKGQMTGVIHVLLWIHSKKVMPIEHI